MNTTTDFSIAYGTVTAALIGALVVVQQLSAALLPPVI